MLSIFRQHRLLLAIGAVLALTLAACGGNGNGTATTDGENGATGDTTTNGDTGTTGDTATPGDTPTTGDTATPGDDSMDQEMTDFSTPFGEACSQIPESGEGSAEGMADDPVATAASNNPLLSTLVEFVGQAELGDTLNNAEALTVFAPINSAFEALPEETAQAVSNDTELLTTVLSHHVHAGEKLSASQLAEQGTVSTLAEGTADLRISQSGDTLEVSSAGSTATVVCGNVETANARVFLVDTVLQPAQ
jgi:uncharacterized surface protein with fasciclin (FAS1) repeats